MKEFSLRERTEMSRAFSAGNYANAYETTDLAAALKRARYTADHTRAAFVLGFFGSYSLDEISDREIFDECYFSAAGQYVVKVAGYCDARDDEYREESGDDSEPSDGDWITTDHVTFVSRGNERRDRFVVPDGQDWRDVMRAKMREQGFFPDVWFISDHGNAHRLTMSDVAPMDNAAHLPPKGGK